MRFLFEELLRSNFRCGRMLSSRVHSYAGVFVVPILDTIYCETSSKHPALRAREMPKTMHPGLFYSGKF